MHSNLSVPSTYPLHKNINSAHRRLIYIYKSHPCIVTSQGLDSFVQDYEMLDTVMSAGSTSSEAPNFSRQSMKKSLADELDSAFENIDLDTDYTLDPIKFSSAPDEDIAGDTSRAANAATEKQEKSSSVQGQSDSIIVANDVSDSCLSSEGSKQQQSSARDKASIVRPSLTSRPSHFIENLSPVNPLSQPLSHEEQTKLIVSKHNRETIERNADGFFRMETTPTITDVQRQAQQAEGIAALQRTLDPAKISGAASASIGSSHTSSSAAVDSMKRPLTKLQINFAEPRSRKTKKPQRLYSPPPSKSKAAPHFSLARDLIASGHKKRIAAPSAPARFVRMPTDPLVDFKRSFPDRGLRISIPGAGHEGGNNSGSITLVPDVDCPGAFAFQNDKPKLEFGIPRAFIADQCFESSCPLRFAHAKGPYHHKGHRDNNIMTGLFGHSNPPPEIWNAYRNMVRITREGVIVVSPEEEHPRRRPNADEDLVIAFAMFHYGELNSMSGEEFHKRYAGRHMSSRISLQSTSTNSSTGSDGSWIAGRISLGFFWDCLQA